MKFTKIFATGVALIAMITNVDAINLNQNEENLLESSGISCYTNQMGKAYCESIPVLSLEGEENEESEDQTTNDEVSNEESTDSTASINGTADYGAYVPNIGVHEKTDGSMTFSLTLTKSQKWILICLVFQILFCFGVFAW